MAKRRRPGVGDWWDFGSDLLRITQETEKTIDRLEAELSELRRCVRAADRIAERLQRRGDREASSEKKIARTRKTRAVRRVARRTLGQGARATERTVIAPRRTARASRKCN
jgi:predicted RNase H-like nuclease (RuvC/YqgF family)